MTCRYSETEWLDVLYTSVRKTPGGVAAAAAFLTQRRGRNITVESLRLRLNGNVDTYPSMEIFELLLEWMQEHNVPHALDALHAMNQRFGLHSTPAETGKTASDSVVSVGLRALEVVQRTGIVAEEIRSALEDGVITQQEVSAIIAVIREERRSLDDLVDSVVAASQARP